MENDWGRRYHSYCTCIITQRTESGCGEARIQALHGVPEYLTVELIGEIECNSRCMVLYGIIFTVSLLRLRNSVIREEQMD